MTSHEKDQSDLDVVLQTFEGERVIPYLEHLQALVEIDASVRNAAIQHYEGNGMQWVTVPNIVGITGACENVDTLFRVGSRSNVNLFISQTGQLGLEQAQQVLAFRGGVYTIIQSGRVEEVEDERHLRQFTLVEEEFGCTRAGMTRETYDEEVMFVALLAHIEDATKSMIRGALEKNADVIADGFGRNIEHLEDALNNAYLRITYEDALVLLNANGYELPWGADLNADQEQSVIRLINAQNRELNGAMAPVGDIPVFIMKYPKEIKFFNMKVSETDDRVVMSADLILPIAGEATGSAVREHDGRKLRERLLGSRMFALHAERGGTLEDFEWYLKIIDRQRTDPHAGYGIGADRVMQYILGLPDIRDCSVLGIFSRQTGDWEPPQVGIVYEAS